VQSKRKELEQVQYEFLLVLLAGLHNRLGNFSSKKHNWNKFNRCKLSFLQEKMLSTGYAFFITGI